jgi:hypothetical protein
MEEQMKKILLSTLSLALVFSLVSSSVSAKAIDRADPPEPELAEHVPGELLIRFSPGVASAQAADRMNEMGVIHQREIDGIQVHLVKLPPGLTVEQAMDRFSHLPGVEFAEPNYILHLAENHQAEIVNQWGLTRIHTEEAWAALTADQKNEILLATVDTGIDRNKSDLSSGIWTNPDETPGDGIDNDGNGYVDDTWGWDFVNKDNNPIDDQMHGSAVTSVMVAAQDGSGVVGVCPWCKAMAVKVLDSQGSGSLDVVASGIIYAAQNGARVINLSLGASVGAQTLENAVNFAWSQGAVVVAAAGNDGQSLANYPAGYANAMAVASTNSGDKHSCFSNYKAGYVSVAAPGEGIYVVDITNSTSGYNYYSGTSLSTPYVTALAGLILGQDPSLTNTQVRSIIENSAVDLGSAGVDGAFGHGRIDAFRAVTGDTSQVTPIDGLSSASDTASGYAHARKLVRDSTGKLHLIWHSDEGALYRIRYATSVDDGTSWDFQPDVFSSPYETYHPALTADDTYLYVAIPSRPGAGLPYKILFTRKPLAGGEWSSPRALLGGTYNAVRPDIYLDPTNGRLHLIASSLDNTPYLYYRSSNTQGETWNTGRQFNITGSSSYTRYASIYTNGDKIYVVAKTVSPDLLTYYYLYAARSMDGGLTWVDLSQLSWYLAFTSGEYGLSLSGVGDRVYMGYEVGSNLYFRRNNGAGWSNYTQLETGDTNNVYKWPTITQASDGQAWLMFQVNGKLYMRHYDGTTWGTREYIGPGNYANLKRGTAGDRVEWVYTICNGSPFDLAYGSRSSITNSAPQANGQNVFTNEDAPVNITLTGSDPDGNPLTYQVVTGPTHGILSGNAPNLTYTPTSNYNGLDSFTFKTNDGQVDSAPSAVVITISPVNDAPVAGDQTVSTSENMPLAISLTASDVDNDALTYNVVGGPAHGVLTGSAPNLTYTPELNYNGPDSFTFIASDGQVDSNTATITITILPVNNPPVADNQSVVTSEDTSKAITLTASDPDSDSLNYSVVSGPTHGTLSGNPPNLTYAPNPNFNGSDSFTFKSNDGQVDSNEADVTIMVTPVNDPPVANGQAVSTSEDVPVAITLTASDIDGDSLIYNVVAAPTHGTLSGTGANLSYTPGQDYSGADSFSFIVNDGQVNSAPATVTITVASNGDLIYLSATTNGTSGGLAYNDEDIVSYNTLTGKWLMYFDGSDVGITGDVDAFALMPDGSVLLSLDAAATVSGLGTVDDSDIIRFTPISTGATTAGTFTWFFDGSDVGLTTNDEDIDAIDFASDGRMVISTLGAFSVTGVSGDDKDLLAFASTSTGANTAGTWSWLFDGSDVGLTTSSEDINGVWIDPVNNQLYLTTTGAFSVTGVSGDGADIFVCTPGLLGSTTSCTFSMYWDGSAFGFAGEVADGIDLLK